MTSSFDPYYEWLGIPVTEQPANHYRLLSIPMYEVNVEVIKSAAERQTIYLRTFQAGERTVVATHMLNEVASARVCLLNAQQKGVYDTQLRFANPSRPTSPIPITGNPVLPAPYLVPSASANIEAVVMRKEKSRPIRVTPVWQRATVMVPVALVSITVIILLLSSILVNDDKPFTPPRVVTVTPPVTLRPPVDPVEPKLRVDPRVPEILADPPVPEISAVEMARFKAALKNARAFQVQRKLSDAAAQLNIAKPLGTIPQYKSEFTRTDFIQQLLEKFVRLTNSAIDSYIPGSEIETEEYEFVNVVRITSSTLTVKVKGEIKEYMRDDLSLGIAMGIARTNFEDGPLKGFMRAAYLLTSPDWKDSYLVKARDFWEDGDAYSAPADSFDKYLSDFENVDITPDDPLVINPKEVVMQDHGDGNALPVVNSIGMQLVKVPNGTFIMGSPESEFGRKSDEPQHPVTISRDFLMQSTEVTQSQWKTVMGTEPWKGKEFENIGIENPATYVSWNDARDFCARLSVTEGKKYRLPTEAEWEFACRAGGRRAWSFGEDKKALGDYAWYRENAGDIDEQYAHQVRLKKPNAFGLYDMHGNVWEWCLDYFGEHFNQQLLENDPTGPSQGAFRVLRGGSWDNEAELTRAAHRNNGSAVLRHPHDGFRVVQELPSDDAKIADDGNSDPLMIPADDDMDLSKLTTTMNNVRKALEGRDMETAKRELVKATSLDKTPGVNEVFQRLAKMTELLDEFVKNSENAIDKFMKGDEIIVEDGLVLSVERVTRTELVIKVGNRLKVYARNQLPVVIAMAISDTYLKDVKDITALKAAFIATQNKPIPTNVAKARKWWEEGPESINTFDLYMVDRYDFQDDRRKAEEPDNPRVFTIDLDQALPSYTLNIPYGGNVDSKNITVQFEVTARGTRAFPSESKQRDPVGVSKSFEAEIMLGQHVTAAMGNIPANALDLIGDVLTRLSYDAVKKEFKIYVKPSTDVVAGKADPFEIALSVQKCEERVKKIQDLIVRLKLEIPVHENNIINLRAFHAKLQGDFQSAVNSKDAVKATQIGAEMAMVEVQFKGQINNQKIKFSRLKSLPFKLAYLASLTRNLDELKHLDIRYRIYQKVDDKDALIIDGW
jgi:formylglycine-generating enzyme required for sulfatase activity